MGSQSKQWRVFKNIAFASCTVMAFAVLLFALRDEKHKYYATYEDAEERGAALNGWLPSFMPHSAAGIQVSVNLDTNEVWLAFRIPVQDLETMLRFYETVPFDKIVLPRYLPNATKAWWPKDLAPENDIPRKSVIFYRLRHNIPDGFLYGGTIAVNTTAGHVWWWRGD